MTEVVTFCHFDQLFDLNLTEILLNIFLRLDPEDLDNCVKVCHNWRLFFARQIIGNEEVKSHIFNHKIIHEWLKGEPKVWKIPIAKALAPPLKIYTDDREILLTTIDSLLVWNRKTKVFKGEFGPNLHGSNHVMIKQFSFNGKIAVSIHKHNNLILIWTRTNYKIIQEIPCLGIEGNETQCLFVKALDDLVVTWLEDGSIVLYGIYRDGTLRRRQVLNGHIQGNSHAEIRDLQLLTASADSKVNLWDLTSGKLLWSNNRSEVKYKTCGMSETRAVVAGTYDQDGYLQIYDRKNGDVLHDLVTLEGNAITDVTVTTEKIIAVVNIRHKLLTSKIMILNAIQGDIIAEQCFVDVMQIYSVKNRLLTVLNNQTGDFRTRISIFNLENDDSVFESEKLAFQYQHNYWKLPVKFDDISIIHTSEEKKDLIVREYDSFFSQFEWDKKYSLLPVQRLGLYDTTLCQRLRKLLLKKICAKCVIM